MIKFQSIDVKTFLNEYWQKKPLVIRQAIPDFITPLSGDELAGLALEEDVESRLVFETPNHSPYWRLQRGPFQESDFTQLPKTHWTLLVQGVDKLIPEVTQLLDHFDFIPQWRIDDVMISYAVKQGSVGPHYDNYDVFLYQASGQRQWCLTTKKCYPENTLKNVELRIMAEFETEETFILEPGDMLYLPAHIGHHGVSLSDDCMTYSFGYRSYQALELWDSLGDYLSEKNAFNALYQDPNWNTLRATSEIPSNAMLQARELLQSILNNNELIQNWFGCFVTRLDQQTEQYLPYPLEEDEYGSFDEFIQVLNASEGLLRDACCRFAYVDDHLFINGVEWDVVHVSWELVELIANHRTLFSKQLAASCLKIEDYEFLYELWKLQWVQWIE